MPARSITDTEIALIKGMLALGMKNKDIQFYFNRPDRPVNSGRISQVAKGTYSDSTKISAAPLKKTKEFIDSFQPSGTTSAVVVSVAGGTQDQGPMSSTALKNLFEEVGVGLQWRLKSGETHEHECKESFHFKGDKWLRAVAALANNRGGYLLFGVYDKGKKGPNEQDLGNIVCGLKNDEFEKLDSASITSRLKAMFDPTPLFETATFMVGGLTVGIIHIKQHPSRPVIASKQEGDIREGDIFFRYPGQSSRIKYSDLRAILDDRDLNARKTLLPMVERLIEIGPARAVIADLKEGVLGDGKTIMQIDAALLKKISLIKEGEFDEKKGATALRLVGDVMSVGEDATHFKKGAVTRHDLESDFLNQNTMVYPKEYIRYAIESVHGTWVPIRYYAKLAGLTKPSLKAFINGTKAAPHRKSQFVQLISKKDAARTPPSAKSLDILATIEKTKAVPEAMTKQEIGPLARAIQGLPRETGVPIEVLLKAIQSWITVWPGVSASDVRRAMCRVDEVFFEL